VSFPDFDRLSMLRGYGRAGGSPAYLYRPTHIEQIASLFQQAAAHGLTIAPRGAGRSYGDASLNGGQVVLDLQRMNRILDWNPDTGVIRAEPGVTIAQLWQYTIEDGWWPPVVSGTMFPTLGGCLGMNIHGKNNYRAGPIGEHVLAFEALLPTGELVSCTPERDPELFYSLISSAGLLGVFTSITLQLKRLQSGDLEVMEYAVPSMGAMLDLMESLKSEADYLVGWVDTTAGGRAIGRGQVHTGHYLHAEDDPAPAASLSLSSQTLPDTLFGIMPKSILWRFMRLGMNRLTVPMVNTGKYVAARLTHHHHYRQSLVAFNFLLDYVPHLDLICGPRGFIQYQSFIPRATAADAYRAILDLSQRRGLPSHLGVTKRHRPDQFLFTHAVDGFSMALDFAVPASAERLQQLTHDLDHLVLEAGGRFYMAKDSTLTPYVVARYLGDETLARFHALKARCDPQNLLQTELYRRVLAPTAAGPVPDPAAAAQVLDPAATAVSAEGAPLEAAPVLEPVPAGAGAAPLPANGNGHRL
jgi:decaprenylphospho-beta-D-ribofuranose 2-oxidase